MHHLNNSRITASTMNTFAFVAIFAVLATANGSVLSSAKIVQGPSTRTTVVGPDGSSISSVAPGGTIIAEDHAPIVAQTAYAAHAYSAPLVAAQSAYAAPVAYAAQTAYAAPVAYAAQNAYAAPVAYAAQTGYAAPVAYAAQTAYAAPIAHTAYAAPIAHAAYATPIARAAYASPVAYASQGVVSTNSVDTVVAGPSGTIQTSKSVHTPAVVASAPLAYSHHGLYI